MLGVGCPTLGCARTHQRPARVQEKIPPAPPSRTLFYLVSIWFAVAIFLQAEMLSVTPSDRSLFPAFVALMLLGLAASGSILFIASLVALVRRPRRLLGWIALAMIMATPCSLYVTLPRVQEEWHKPDAATLGYELFQAGKYQEALDLYTSALARKQAYPDARTLWVQIGKCQDRLGHYELALAAFDKAEGAGGLFPYDCLDRAHCVSRYEGPYVATKWLEARAPAEKDPIFFRYVIGLFHFAEKRYSDAVVALTHHIEMAIQKDGFQFDKDGNLDPRTATTGWGEVNWDAPSRLAWAQYEMGNLDEAFRSGTMGLTLSQYRYKTQGFYSGAAEIEAGDTECRVIRARILMAKGELTAAKREVEQARRSKEAAPGHCYEQRAIQVEQDLASRLKEAEKKEKPSSPK